MKYAPISIETERVVNDTIGSAIEVHRHLGPAVAALHVIHEAKVISYLRTTGMRIGLLLNFHESTLKQVLKRIIV